MTKTLSRLAVAAVLLSSVPFAARADGWRDGPRPDGWSGPAVPAYPAPPPAAYPGGPDRPRDAREWREHRGRERELAEVRAQLRALDAQRDRFYAENGRNPWRTRRFDRWYVARRAELERRKDELRRVAWR